MGEQMLRTLCVVADRFEAFASHPPVRTVSGFVAEVHEGRYDAPDGPLSICWGQGITDYDRAYVHDVLCCRGLQNTVLTESSEPAPVARSRSHKHREANVVLAGLVRTSDHDYRAALRLHPDNEFLLDHQSVEHLPGMVVIEAFRQMSIAVCEQFVAAEWPQQRYGYLWHGMDTRFTNFLFPLAAVIDCTVVEQDLSDRARLRMCMDVSVKQGGSLCAGARIDFTAYDLDRLVGNEHRVAGRTLHAVLAGVAPADPQRLLEMV
jgi:A-factor biosynthesis hotdog protein